MIGSYNSSISILWLPVVVKDHIDKDQLFFMALKKKIKKSQLLDTTMAR